MASAGSCPSPYLDPSQAPRLGPQLGWSGPTIQDIHLKTPLATTSPSSPASTWSPQSLSAGFTPRTQAHTPEIQAHTHTTKFLHLCSTIPSSQSTRCSHHLLEWSRDRRSQMILCLTALVCQASSGDDEFISKFVCTECSILH